MIKNVLAVSAVTAMLLLSGCGNDAEDRMLSQQMLDSGDYDGVISQLESKEIKTDDDNLKLASAYMDKAGFSVTDLVSIVNQGDENTEASFASFVTSVEKEKNPETLGNLEKAISYYTQLVTIEEYVAQSPKRVDSLDSYSQELDLDTNELFLGMAYIAKVATVLSYMGDVSKLEDAGEDGNLLASGCAMSKVYAEAEIPEECASVNYVATTEINGTTYTPIEVVLSNGLGSYNLLATQDRTELVLTDYTTTCNELYPCPVKDENLTVLGALLDTLNSAFDFILSAAPDDVKEDIVSYRDEIDSNRDTVVSVTELTNYLNSEMSKN
jgi:hypothetical protein